MSTNRPSSGVQDLRAMFENQTADEQRSSSPNRAISVGETDRRSSKVRASFVSVDRPNNLSETNGAQEPVSAQETDRPTTVKGNMESTRPSEAVAAAPPAKEAITAVDTSVLQTIEANKPNGSTETKQEKESNTSVNTANTVGPTQEGPVSPGKALSQLRETKQSVPTPSSADTPLQNKVEPQAIVEKEANAPKPAVSPTVSKASYARAVPESPAAKTPARGVRASFGNTTSPTTKQATREETPSKSKTPKSKPSLTFRQSKENASPVASKQQQLPKSPARPTTSDSKASEQSATSSKLASRSGRASLTAQTASSAAKSKPSTAGAGKATAVDKKLPVRTRPRSPTRPLSLSSHLTAPTAASSARQESNKSAAAAIKTGPIGRVSTSSVRSSMGDAKPPTHSAKTGLGRSNSTATRPTPRASTAKPVVASEGFLARMMRPTASSSSKAHDKPDSKPAPSKPAPSSRPRATADSRLKATSVSEKSKAVQSPAKHGKPSSKSSDAVKESSSAADGPNEGHVAAVETPRRDTLSSAPPTQGSKQDETTIDSSMAGISTPSVENPTIR